MVAIQNAVAPREIGTATASANLFRALGGSVGVAAFGAGPTSRLNVWLPLLVPAGHGYVDARTLQATPKVIDALPHAVHAGVAQAVAHSLHTVFLVATLIAAVALLIALALEEVPLRGRAAPGGAKASGSEPRPARTAES